MDSGFGIGDLGLGSRGEPEGRAWGVGIRGWWEELISC